MPKSLIRTVSFVLISALLLTSVKPISAAQRQPYLIRLDTPSVRGSSPLFSVDALAVEPLSTHHRLISHPFLSKLFIPILGTGAGILSRLLGVGGGIVIEPGLQFFMRVPVAEASATSLAAIVPVTVMLSGLDLWLHPGNIHPFFALALSIPSVTGTFLGTQIKKRARNEAFVQMILAGILAFTAFKYLSHPVTVQALTTSAEFLTPGSLVGLVLGGICIGALSAWVGVGGGFLYVPLLHFALGLAQAEATSTSLMTVAVTASVGALLQRPSIRTKMAWQLMASAVVGALMCFWLLQGVSTTGLEKFFGVAVGVLSLIFTGSVLSKLWRYHQASKPLIHSESDA